MHLFFFFFPLKFKMIKPIVFDTNSVHIVIITIVHLPQCKAQTNQTDLIHAYVIRRAAFSTHGLDLFKSHLQWGDHYKVSGLWRSPRAQGYRQNVQKVHDISVIAGMIREMARRLAKLLGHIERCMDGVDYRREMRVVSRD